MKTRQVKPIIPEALFRVMVQIRNVPFSDMVRMEKFNRGGQPHIWGWVFTPSILFILSIPYIVDFQTVWKFIAVVFGLICIGCGARIGLKENTLWYRFRTMCLDLDQFEAVFSVNRELDLDAMTVAVKRDLVDGAMKAIQFHGEDLFRKKFARRFRVAKNVFGDRIDDGVGYRPFFDEAEYRLAQLATK